MHCITSCLCGANLELLLLLLQKRRPLKSVRRMLESTSQQSLGATLTKIGERSPADHPKRQGSKRLKEEAGMQERSNTPEADRVTQASDAVSSSSILSTPQANE